MGVIAVRRRRPAGVDWLWPLLERKPVKLVCSVDKTACRVPRLARPHLGLRSTSLVDDGRDGIDLNLVENAILSPVMIRRTALFGGHDQGGRKRAQTRRVELFACRRVLFTKPANRHLAKDIDALMPWACMPKPGRCLRRVCRLLQPLHNDMRGA